MNTLASLVCILLLFANVWSLPPPPSVKQTLEEEARDAIMNMPNNIRIGIITAQTRNSRPSTDQDLAEELADAYGGEEFTEPVQFLHLSQDYEDLFIKNKRDWANFHGYEHVHTVIETDDTSVDIPVEMIDQSITWVKIDLMQKYLDTYDWICWLDMDTIIVDFNVKLEEIIRKAIKQRPHVDLIIEGSERFKKMDGTAIKSGVMLLRNSHWSHQFLDQLKELLADNDWQNVVRKAVTFQSGSFLDDNIAFLLNSHQMSDNHVFFTPLQDRWNQHLVYMPKIGILHFSGCIANNQKCLEVFNSAVDHMLQKEQMYVYIAAPYVQHIYNIFVYIYVLFAIDRMLHIFGRLFLKNRVDTLQKADLRTIKDDERYPMVVVQLPMFNEKSCCRTIISSSCSLEWPRSRLLVQVVDDSTSADTRQIIDECVREWQDKGVNIQVRRRAHRHGFKAGAMNEAMEFCPADTKYIAIFDADFLPQPDFLRQTVPYLMAEKKAAFVQTCWIYTNAKESLLTRMQEISLNFHFLCEQEVRFRSRKFFNFNGTAGVWRWDALSDVGGWHTDTLVEDMDLSLRVWANGWDFIYLHDVKCLNEIPPTFDAYRGQQHRWTSGPMQVLKKAFRTVYASRSLSVLDKLFCLWFFVRNYVHLINFLYFLVLIPTMIWFPRVTLYEWAVVYLPTAISMTNVIFTPNEWYHVVHYVLFENAMCLYKTGALISGILNIGKAKQWIVTPKFARKLSTDEVGQGTLKGGLVGIWEFVVQLLGRIVHFRVHFQEVVMTAFLFSCAFYGFLLKQYGLASFSLLNAVAYSVMAVGGLGR